MDPMYEKRIGEKRRIKSIKRSEKFCKGKLLDVGSSSGILSNYFFKKGFDIEGIEIDEKCLKEARKRFKDINFSFKDVTKKLNKKYDTILLIGVLEEIDLLPTKLLNKLKKDLNHGGRIIIHVRNFHSLKRRVKTLFGLEPLDRFDSRLWIFTRRILEKTIKETGYNILKISSNGFDSFRRITFPTPNSLSEEILAIIEPKKFGK